jgi:succinate dehydrogenase / fumarate reductase iron-sulfur subunit
MELGSDVIEVAPLPSFDNIRDLVPDLEVMFTKLQIVKPYIVRKRDPEEIDNPTGEFLQSEREVLDYLQFSYCIKCGICLSACPTLATDRGYIGPQALTQAIRYSIDTRDDGLESRREAVDVLNGPFKCHFAGACSEACPKGVDPAMGIQLLRRALVMGLRRKGAAPVAGRVEGAKKKDGAPEPPKRTV